MYDVCALGELLIDFTPAGKSESGNVLFERNPGGGPPNLLTAVSRLGGKAAFIGKVGNDQFGLFLKETLEINNINTSGLVYSETVNTTLAFVHLKEDGDRSFSFYRDPGADIMLEFDEVDTGIIDNSSIFHFSSLTLTNEPARTTTLKTLDYVKKRGKTISYDPNYRPLLWTNETTAKEYIQLGLKYADIIKVSDYELELLTGEKDLLRGSKILYENGASLVLITLGPDGCFYRYAGGTGKIDGFKVKAVDTTGAGDAFTGGVLSKLVSININALTKNELEDIIRFGNAVGALCASGRGGIPSIPRAEAVRKLLHDCSN